MLKPYDVTYFFKKARSSVYASDIKAPQRLYIFTIAKERVETHIPAIMKAISPCFGGRTDNIREYHVMHFKTASSFLEPKSDTVIGKISVYAETISDDEPIVTKDRLKIAMDRVSRRRKGEPVEDLPVPVEPKYLRDSMYLITGTDEFLDDVEREAAHD